MEFYNETMTNEHTSERHLLLLQPLGWASMGGGGGGGGGGGRRWSGVGGRELRAGWQRPCKPEAESR